MIKKGSAVWKGSLKEGGGTISTETGVLKNAPYGFKARFEDGPGTNPEELIGAAHAACFSMALSVGLGNAGFTAESIQTEAAVRLEKVGDAEGQGQFGADDGQVDPFGGGEFGDRRHVRQIDRDGARYACNARVSGRCQHRHDFRVQSKPRDERVFTRAAAENQNSHRLSGLGRVMALHGDAARAGLFR